MQHIEDLIKIRQAAEYIFNGLMCGCIQMSIEAGKAHRELVDRFFSENVDCMDRDQYREAQLNIFYFISLIDRAIEGKRQ